MHRFCCFAAALLALAILARPAVASRQAQERTHLLPQSPILLTLPLSSSPERGGSVVPPVEDVPAREALPVVAHSPLVQGQGRQGQAPEPGGDRAKAVTEGAPQANDAVERSAAAAIISGSPRLGIIEHQLVRNGRGGGKPEISMSYPSFGIPVVDGHIRQWVTGIANAFDGSFSGNAWLEDSPASPPELWSSFSVTSPSPSALSVTFEIWTYTGGAHGNLDIITLNYNALTSQSLGLVDIFEDPDAALSIMSTWSYKELSKRLGGMRQEQMLRTGLTPLPENFASLTLIPSGIRVNFQPYQVAPWAAGAQRVDIPLDVLHAARPLLMLWGK